MRFLDSFWHLFSHWKVFTKDITVYFLPDSMATKLAAHKPHQKKKLERPTVKWKTAFSKDVLCSPVIKKTKYTLTAYIGVVYIWLAGAANQIHSAVSASIKAQVLTVCWEQTFRCVLKQWHNLSRSPHFSKFIPGSEKIQTNPTKKTPNSDTKGLG